MGTGDGSGRDQAPGQAYRAVVAPEVDEVADNRVLGRYLGVVVLAAAEEPKMLVKAAVDGEVRDAASAEVGFADHRRGVTDLPQL